MTTEISYGEPPVEGQYIGFVNGDNGFAQAKMLTWHGGRWHYWRPVYAWIGPIPVTTVDALIAESNRVVKARHAATEYDL